MLVFNRKYRTSQYLILLSFFALIVIPNIVMAVLSILYLSERFRDRITDNARQQVEAVNTEMQKLGDEISRRLRGLSSDAGFQSILRSTDFSTLDSDLYWRALMVDGYIGNYLFERGISMEVLICPRGDGFYRLGGLYYIDPAELKVSPWYRRAVDADGRIAWSGMVTAKSILNEPLPAFGLSQAVFDRQSYNLLAVIYVELPPTVFSQLLPRAPDFAFSITFAADGRIIARDGASSPVDVALEEIIVAGVLSERTDPVVDLNGNSHILISSSPNDFVWRTVVGIPLDVSRVNLKRLIVVVTVLLLTILAAYTYFLWTLLRNFSVPLRNLVSIVNDMHADSGDLLQPTYRCREVLNISKGVVSLVESSKSTMAKLSLSQRESRRNRLGMLQAQVNPHFLYNVLNTARLSALEADQKKIFDLMTSLIVILRATVSREGKFITLAEEMKNLGHYLDLYRSVHGVAAELEIEVGEDLMNCLIPSFILQPVVENALVHGFDKPAAGHPTIRIHTARADSRFSIQIEDNGRGLDLEVIESLERGGKTPEKLTSLGLNGIHEKIRLLCGSGFGVRVENAELTGARVTIDLPCHMSSDGNAP